MRSCPMEAARPTTTDANTEHKSNLPPAFAFADFAKDFDFSQSYIHPSSLALLPKGKDDPRCVAINKLIQEQYPGDPPWEKELRYAAVGWFINGKLEVHLRLGLDPSFNEAELKRQIAEEQQKEEKLQEKGRMNAWEKKLELIKAIKEQFGNDSVVVAKKGTPGRVHTETVALVRKSFPQYPEKGVVGFSFYKRGDDVSFTNRSYKNRRGKKGGPFEPNALFVACFLFDKRDPEETKVDLGYDLRRSIPKKPFEQITSCMVRALQPKQPLVLLMMEKFDEAKATQILKSSGYVLTDDPEDSLKFYDCTAQPPVFRSISIVPEYDTGNQQDDLKQMETLGVKKHADLKKALVSSFEDQKTIELTTAQLSTIAHANCYETSENFDLEDHWERIRLKKPKLQQIEMQQLLMKNLMQVLLGCKKKHSKPDRTAFDLLFRNALQIAADSGLKIDVDYEPDGVRQEKLPTALYLAAEKGFLKMIRTLIKFGADVNAVNSDNNETPILAAIRTGNIKAVKILLKHGALLNPAENDLPIVYAAKHNQPEIVKLLLKKMHKENADILHKILDKAKPPEHKNTNVSKDKEDTAAPNEQKETLKPDPLIEKLFKNEQYAELIVAAAKQLQAELQQQAVSAQQPSTYSPQSPRKFKQAQPVTVQAVQNKKQTHGKQGGA